MKKLAAIALLSITLMACNQTPKNGANKTDTTVTPATDTSASSKLKNYTDPAQEQRLREVSPDSTKKSTK